MKCVKTLIITCILATAMSGCVWHAQPRAQQSAAVVAPSFTPPTPPVTIQDPQARKEYMVENFWVGYDFSDSLLLNNDEVTGSAFALYLQLLTMCDSTLVRKGVGRMLDRAYSADSVAFARFAELSEDYLYDPNSPMRNEECYIPVLEYIIADQRVGSIEKIRPRMQLKMALKNRVGEPAADFVYTLSNGSRSRLYSLDAEYVILFFNNPDCHDCARVKEFVASSEIFADLHHAGRLKILSIYPDADLELWRKAEYPSIVINSYDAEHVIDSKSIYDLKAIPCLYLLDREKRVVLKDAAVEQIEADLYNK